MMHIWKSSQQLIQSVQQVAPCVKFKQILHEALNFDRIEFSCHMSANAVWQEQHVLTVVVSSNRRYDHMFGGPDAEKCQNEARLQPLLEMPDDLAEETIICPC